MTGKPRRFWRIISLRSSGNEVIGRVYDNVHDFTVSIDHDGARVTDVRARADRVPWVTCPGGVARLKQLVGIALRSRVGDLVDQSYQCTHMLDVAKLAIAHAGDGHGLTYSMSVTPTDAEAGCTARITRDGSDLFEWHVIDNVIEAPPLFRGHVTTGRAVWPEAVERDQALKEAAMVLRRCLMVYRGRLYATEEVRHARELNYASGACLSFQPEYVGQAARPDDFVDLD
jgi:hypothetical protein